MSEELGRYTILEEIGRGGFAIVYRAKDTELDRLVALKELRQGLWDNPEWLNRFKREARTIARLNHPSIVTIHDVLEVAERLFLVMPLIDGPSLDRLIAAQGSLSWTQTEEIITTIAEALDYAHSLGILHRDLKPANILLDPERGPQLSDFGLAKLASEASSGLTAEGDIVGTPHYIAPEIWEGQGATSQSDIYALGCIIYEMLAGEKLFAGEVVPAVMMTHFNPLVLPQSWPEEVPPGLSEILKQALAKQPNERYASAGELAEALTKAGLSLGKSQSQLELHLLGPPQVELEGLPVEIKRRKALALLIYLAVNGDRQRRDSLATLLWPESSQQSARKELRRNLSELNLALGGNWLDIDRESVGLKAGFGLDVAQFQQYLADETTDAQTLITAADLYRDDFLTGFTLPDCPEFDEWQFFQSESLRQLLASALEKLAVILSDQADFETAIPYARRWLVLDPLHEPAHRQLMQLYAQVGQQAAALRQYDLCRQTLEDELGISPTPETTALYEQIRDRKVGPAEPAAMTGSVEETPAQAVAGELRAVTVLSARVSGANDAEEVVELAHRLLVIMEGMLTRYEAQIDRLLGEEVLAVFGAPQAHEDDHERALWAALKIQSEAQQQGLMVGIGINTGDVYVGRTGPERYQAGTITGPVVNLVSRLADASGQGEIIVGPDTYRLTTLLFDFEGLAPIKVKGIAEPLSIYRLLGAKTGRGKGRGIVGLESPLVGRETEFGALQEADQRLQAGVGGIVTLVGEAGLGKSRLVAELQGQSSMKVSDEPQVQTSSSGQSSVQWVEGRCLSFGGSIAYLLWLDVLQDLLGVTAEDPPTAVRDVLRQRVETLCPDRFDDVFPHLAWLMSLPLPEEVEAVLRGLGNKGLKVGTFRAVEILIESTARQQGPLVVICEDLHWADPTSLELLEQLLFLTDRAPVLFVCLFRPETEHGCWRIKETAARQYRHRHTDLWLETLSDVESERLVNNLLRLEELPPGFAERILDRAEGNPFYVEEIIRALIDDEDIVWDDNTGRMQVVGTVSEIDIPDTVRGVLMARIDRLQEETKRVLQLAAVVGRVFFYRVLEAIAQQERDLSSHLSTLQREEMIRERARIPELEYIFKHQLTQEAAYRGLLRKERRGFHRQVAEALERIFPDRIEEQVELLAHHWEQAEAPEKAIEYLVRAGQKEAGRYANIEALGYFERALALANGQDRYDDILARRAQVLLGVFQGQEAATDYQQLLDRARQSGNRPGELEALLGLASAYYTIALDEPDFASESLELYEQAYTLAGELDDKAGMVRALVSTIWFTDYWSEYGNQAVANLEEAWGISQEVGNEELMMNCMMARVARGLVSIDQAEELLSRLESRHDLPRLKDAYFPLLWWYLESGNFERCVECCDISINLAARLGAPPVMYSTIKGLALLGLGRYDTAWVALQEEVADQEHSFGSALKGVGTGMYYLELMEYGQAITVLKAAIVQANRVGRAWLSSWAQEELSRSLVRHGQLAGANPDQLTQDLATMDAALTTDVLAEIALSQEKLDEALRQAEKACAEAKDKSFWAFPPLRGLPHVEKSRTEAEKGDRRPSYLSALILQLQILLKLGRPGDVIPLADKAIRAAGEMGYRPLLWRLRAAKAQAMGMLGDGEVASQEYKAAAVIVRDLADTIVDPKLKRTFLSNNSVSLVLERD